MNKFKVFDFLNNLLSNSSVNEILNTPINNLLKSDKNAGNSTQNSQESERVNLDASKKIKSYNYSQKAIISLLNNHDKISRQIDAENQKRK